MNYKDIIRQGYNKVSHAYYGDNGCPLNNAREDWVKVIIDRLDPGSKVLELGCGCGMPAAKLLAEKFSVLGIDISDTQIDRARQFVPDAEFIRMDFLDYEFPSGHYDAIVSFYAIVHVPLDRQLDLLERITVALKPGGLLMLIAGHRAWTGTEDNWLGVEGATMYWSHADRDTYAEWIKKVGLVLEWEEFIPEDNSGHSLFLAHKPGGKAGC
jgi:cyclopropane fatty-acyl-phospholipid synthase-like methyltransferase